MLPQYHSGDVLIVTPEGKWHNNDICLVSTTDGKVWVKHTIRRGLTISLESDNPGYETIDLQINEIDYIHRVIMSISR